MERQLRDLFIYPLIEMSIYEPMHIGKLLLLVFRMYLKTYEPLCQMVSAYNGPSMTNLCAYHSICLPVCLSVCLPLYICISEPVSDYMWVCV